MINHTELSDRMDQAIREAKRLVITGHQNPDGDCLGSILGLGRSLRLLGKEVDMVLDDCIPDHLAYIPGVEDIGRPDPEKSYDVFIMVDIGDLPRLGSSALLKERAPVSLCFDHHTTNGRINDFNLVLPESSSTCQLIAEFLIRHSYPFDKDLATCLYTGLITDSNRYLYKSSRQEAMRTGADLLDRGADADLVYLHEYQSLDRRLIAFQGHVVETAEYLQGGRIALANLRREVLDHFGLPMAEAESVVDILKNLKGVEVACIMKDMETDLQKVSLRSKSYYNVARLAQSFGGGGHIQAAGCSLTASNEQAYVLLKEALEKIEWEK